MKYDHIVVIDGVWYSAGTEVPVEEPISEVPIADDSQGGQTASDSEPFSFLSDWLHEKIDDDSMENVYNNKVNIREELKSISDFVHERKPNAKKKVAPNPYAGVYVSKTYIKRAKNSLVRDMARKSKIPNWKTLPIPKLRDILIETYSTRIPEYKIKQQKREERRALREQQQALEALQDKEGESEELTDGVSD